MTPDYYADYQKLGIPMFFNVVVLLLAFIVNLAVILTSSAVWLHYVIVWVLPFGLLFIIALDIELHYLQSHRDTCP